MSNILIIKHGSLGDIAQASGAIQDIYENHKNDQIYALTTKPFINLLKRCPYIKDVILDKRLSRFNLVYIYLLMRKIKKLNISKVYDLQNSSRTSFYKKILFPNSNYEKWSSSITTLPDNTKKEEFDKISVLERFNHQLKTSGLNTVYTLRPDFTWSCEDINHIKKEFELKKYIVLFPFCSPHLIIKKWPFYNELIRLIKKNFLDEFKVVIAPGPNEVVLNISQLASLIKDSSFVVANDTGPAHMAAHLGVKGLSLFGKHTTAYKVSIETKNFKAIQVNELKKLSAEKVFQRLKENIV